MYGTRSDLGNLHDGFITALAQGWYSVPFIQ